MISRSAILERQSQLDEMEQALELAVAGAGGVVLICGEAGIGKTTLVELFAERARAADVPVLSGACDALHTPRPLGPLLDIARAAGGHLQAIAEGEPRREKLFDGLVALLQRRQPAPIVVVEDAHWADFATLDLLTFLGRRMRDVSGLLVVTFRDDELASDHPLREVLAVLPRGTTRRLTLSRLSPDAVAELARRAGRAPRDLYELTSGNPFYVSEVLGTPGEAVPPSIEDALFARARSLTDGAVEMLDVVALAPGQIERRLLDAVLGSRADDVRACVSSGVLVTTDGKVGFRHELARHAWQRAMDETRRRELHARLFGALEASRGAGMSVDATRLVHHAVGAEDAAAIFRLAPAAGAEAARLSAHREAAAHYEATLDAAPETIDRAERASLLEALGLESYLSGGTERAVTAFEEARTIRRELGDGRRQSESDRWLARLAWYRGDGEGVLKHVSRAIDAVEPLGPSPELARAYGLRSQFLMNAEENAPAIEWGERALAMARAVGDLDAEAHALINVGAALFNQGDALGRERLSEALEFARRHEILDAEARTLLNLGTFGTDWRDVELAREHLAEAVRLCIDHDMIPYSLCATGGRALLRLWAGEWAEAAGDASFVVGHPRVAPLNRVPPLIVLGLLRARRGDPGAWEALDEARALAEPTGEQHWIAPVAAARAEVAWLEGGAGRVASELRAAFALALERENPWVRGELSLWLWRAGALDEPPGTVAEPYARSLAGDSEGAAATWERLGFPYERALALVDSVDPAIAREGLRILQDLGATRTAAVASARLRDRGVRGLPRGPRLATRGNPAGLTRRQAEVLGLLARGMSNQRIASRLRISPKTVEHHVSAVLSKLEVGSRTEAALRATELGLPDLVREHP